MKKCKHCKINCENDDGSALKKCFVSKKESLRTYKMLDSIRNVRIISVDGCKSTISGNGLQIEPEDVLDELIWNYDDELGKLRVRNKKGMLKKRS